MWGSHVQGHEVRQEEVEGEVSGWPHKPPQLVGKGMLQPPFQSPSKLPPPAKESRGV